MTRPFFNAPITRGEVLAIAAMLFVAAIIFGGVS
jgi:hypothetical protein